MSLALLQPAGLAALAALILPLVIHLARRSERRPTDFAALQWLQARARPRRNLRFDEWLLLALRLLLVALLAVLLATPVLRDAAETTAWIVAVPGVPAEVLREAGESTDDAEVERHWLAPGFPDAVEAMPTRAGATASLLRELDASLSAGTPLTVIVPEVIDGADAERPRLSRKVEWKIVPGQPTKQADSVPQPAMPILHIRHGADHAGPVRYLRAAASAWRAERAEPDEAADGADIGIEAADAGTPLPDDAKLLVWLVPGPLPANIHAWIEAGGIALLDSKTDLPELDDALPHWRDTEGAVLMRGRRLGRGQVLRWTRPMTPVAIPDLLEPGFARQLRDVFADPPPPPARVPASAYAPTTGVTPWPQAPRDLSPWLALLIAGLFLIERWLAASPRRRAPA